MPHADPVSEHYLKAQAKHANGLASPVASPCDSAYDHDRDRDVSQKHESRPSHMSNESHSHVPSGGLDHKALAHEV